MSLPDRTLVMLDDERYLEPFVGYRAWRVSADCGRVTLHAIAWQAVAWPIGVYEAICMRKVPHPVPGPLGTCGNHGCGIFAYRHPRTPTMKYNPRSFLLGEVHLWGRVRIHEFGYRAQYARVSAIWEPYSTEEALRSPTLMGARLVAEMAAKQYEAAFVQPPPEAHQIIAVAG